MGLDPEKAKKCMCVIKVVNYITSAVLIGFGIGGIIFISMYQLAGGKVFLLFSPIYMILFGFIILANQCQIKFMINYFTFLRSLIGRGIFTIYLSSSVFYYFTCSEQSDYVLAWVLGTILFAIGIFYLVLHCCAGKQYKEELQSAVV